MITVAPDRDGIALALAPAVNGMVDFPTRWVLRAGRAFGGPLLLREAVGMRWLFQPLLMLVASSTESELARQVEFLKAENQMLRKRLPKAIRFIIEEEKSLIVKLGQAIGAKVKSLLTVASYPTYRRWVNQIDPPAPGTYPNRSKRST